MDDGDKPAEKGSVGAIWRSLLDFIAKPSRILVLGLICLLASSLLEHFKVGSVVAPDSNWFEVSLAQVSYFTRFVLKDFGIALIVVFGIALLVEGPSRDRLEKYNRGITENALSSYLKTGLPTEFFDYMRALAKDAVFVREQMEVTIRLIRIENRPDLLIVEQENHYLVVNNTANAEDYLVSVYVEKPLVSGFGQYPNCRLFAIDGNDLSPEEKRKADEEWPDTDDLKTYRHKITVPQGSNRRVKTICRTVKYARDHYVWSSIHPAMGLTVVVEAPDNVKTFVSILHPQCLTEIRSSVGGSIAQKVTRPVMPGTAAEIVWNPA